MLFHRGIFNEYKTYIRPQKSLSDKGVFNIIHKLVPSHPHFFSFVKTYTMYFNSPDEYSVSNLVHKINTQKFYLITFRYICDFVLSIKGSELKIEYFMVSPNHQGTGIGRFCLTMLINQIKYHTIMKSIVLECKKELIPLYKKFGAKVIQNQNKYSTMEINTQ